MRAQSSEKIKIKCSDCAITHVGLSTLLWWARTIDASCSLRNFASTVKSVSMFSNRNTRTIFLVLLAVAVIAFLCVEVRDRCWEIYTYEYTYITDFERDPSIIRMPRLKAVAVEVAVAAAVAVGAGEAGGEATAEEAMVEEGEAEIWKVSLFPYILFAYTYYTR